MAGMRIGFACGNPQLIKFLNDVKYSFTPTPWTALPLLPVWLQSRIKHISQRHAGRSCPQENGPRKNCPLLASHFRILRPILFFASHNSCPAKEIFEALREEHIYVRYFPKPRIDNYLRITVGTQKEMEKLIQFLKI